MSEQVQGNGVSAAELAQLIADRKVKLASVLDAYKIRSLKELPLDQFGPARQRLLDKKP